MVDSVIRIWCTFAIKKEYYANHPDEELKVITSDIRNFMGSYCQYEGKGTGPVTVFNSTFSCKDVELPDAQGILVSN